MLIFITTLNKNLLEVYGYNFFNSFEKYANEDCALNVIFEGNFTDIKIKYKKISFITFDSESHKRFLKFYGGLYEARGLKIVEVNTAFLGKQFKTIRDFRFDAIRFSYKVFAINQARLSTEKNNFVWIDADVICLRKFSASDIEPFMPLENQLMSYLGRDRFPQPDPYSECGFLGFNSHHPYLNDFLYEMENLYTSGEIFSLKEWHDSWLWDHVRKKYEAKGVDFKNISGSFICTEHPFINSGLGNFFDHLKGPERKKIGHSFADDYQK
jgi:hypothetical protein